MEVTQVWKILKIEHLRRKKSRRHFCGKTKRWKEEDSIRNFIEKGGGGGHQLPQCVESSHAQVTGSWKMVQAFDMKTSTKYAREDFKDLLPNRCLTF